MQSISSPVLVFLVVSASLCLQCSQASYFSRPGRPYSTTLNRTVLVDNSRPSALMIRFERARYNDDRYIHNSYEVKILSSSDKLTVAVNQTTGRNIAPINIPKVLSKTEDRTISYTLSSVAPGSYVVMITPIGLVRSLSCWPTGWCSRPLPQQRYISPVFSVRGFACNV